MQGVGYRDFCRRAARTIARDLDTQLTGYARNLPDGNVEVPLNPTWSVAQGFGGIKYYGWPDFGQKPAHDQDLLRQLRQAAGARGVAIASADMSALDAMLPEEPESTLRERMRVTRKKYCWTCHEKMDPLGLPFEMYNHAGLLRTTELEKPVDTSGEIIDSGDPALDGPVKNALEMIEKLAASERVEQVFVRYAFRFWMGRNETLNDAPVLQAAHKAYRESDGSMNALITSLLTSDAFLYRKVEAKLAEK